MKFGNDLFCQSYVKIAEAMLTPPNRGTGTRTTFHGDSTSSYSPNPPAETQKLQETKTKTGWAIRDHVIKLAPVARMLSRMAPMLGKIETAR